jgi:LmbE family N-acetylglucosaminyl deacetylase
MGLTWRENLGLPNRSLEATLENRAKLAEVFRRTRPRWLFAPYWEDAHPDHRAATQLVEDARFWSKLTKSTLAGEPHHPERIYNYYCVHLKMAAQPAFVLDISAEWPQKLAAIQAYESQFITGRPTEPFSFVDRLRDEAAYWGKVIGVAYGEPYTCREPIGLAGFGALV